MRKDRSFVLGVVKKTTRGDDSIPELLLQVGKGLSKNHSVSILSWTAAGENLIPSLGDRVKKKSANSQTLEFLTWSVICMTVGTLCVLNNLKLKQIPCPAWQHFSLAVYVSRARDEYLVMPK